MSQRLISLNPDLKQLRDEGYNVRVQANCLVMDDVPYVTVDRTVQTASLISTLTDVAGDITQPINDHVVWFSGSHPYRADGARFDQIVNEVRTQDFGEGIVGEHSFSSKPPNKPPPYFDNYYEKMTSYVRILLTEALEIEPTATAQTYPVIADDAEEGVFRYIDTASSKAGIGAYAEKLALGKVAIVGLGGSGSYVLDLIAKAPIKEIHLFDADVFSQHNAFRSPGAPSVEQLKARPTKAQHFASVYDAMRRGVIAHNVYVDASNIELLEGMDFVFLCMDRGDLKLDIVRKLEELGVSFIDVGMGIYEQPGGLAGTLRVTTSTPDSRDPVHEKDRIPFVTADAGMYATNIQIADLNALNAALAVVRWKKLYGFYADLEHERYSAYDVDGNHINNDDQVA